MILNSSFIFIFIFGLECLGNANPSKRDERFLFHCCWAQNICSVNCVLGGMAEPSHLNYLPLSLEYAWAYSLLVGGSMLMFE